MLAVDGRPLVATDPRASDPEGLWSTGNLRTDDHGVVTLAPARDNTEVELRAPADPDAGRWRAGSTGGSAALPTPLPAAPCARPRRAPAKPRSLAPGTDLLRMP